MPRDRLTAYRVLKNYKQPGRRKWFFADRREQRRTVKGTHRILPLTFSPSLIYTIQNNSHPFSSRIQALISTWCQRHQDYCLRNSRMGSHQYQPGIYTMMGSKFMILVPRLIYLIGYRDMNKPTQIGESFVTHKDNKDLAAFSSSICHTGSYVLAENISSCDIGPKSPFPTSTLSHEVARSAEADSFTAQYRYFPFKANDSSSWLYNKQLYTSQLVGPSLSHDTSLSPKFPLPISTVSDGSKSRELGSPRQRSNPH